MQKTYTDICAVCRNADKINEENLRKILSDNQHTDFGKQYNFSAIKSIDDYRKKVPLTEYKMLKPYIDATYQGENLALTSYSPVGFCLTSGTEGDRKLIPVSETALERYSDYIEWFKNKIYHENGGRRLFLSGFRTGLNQEEKREHLLSEIYYQHLFQKGILSFDEYAGGQELLFDQTGENLFYGKIWIGFCVEEITSIESIFLYDQLIFFQYMESHWREILENIRSREVPDWISLSDKVKKYLCSYPVSEERLNAVERECSKGFEGIASRLWRKLSLASGISNPSFSGEETMIRRYLGTVPVYYFSYVASECHMGVAMQPEDYRFVMLPESAFYEFLPYSENDVQENVTYLPQEVEPGKLYEIILTNFSGLYRYRLGDVVRIAGFYEESPVVEFAFRKNQMLNIAGEKITVQQIEKAMGFLMKKVPFDMQEYCIAELEGKIPARYGAVFSVKEKEIHKDNGRIAGQLDQVLKNVNEDYRDLRNLGFLEKPEVLFLEPQEYTLLLKENGAIGGHNKPRHMAVVFSEETWAKWRNRD